MTANDHPRRRLGVVVPALLVALVALLLAGCGSDSKDESSTSAAKKSSSGDGGKPTKPTREQAKECEPVEQPFTPAGRNESAKLGTEIELDASKLELGSGAVKLRPQQLVVATQLTTVSDDADSRKEVVYAAPGAHFVGVVFTVTNDTSEEIAAGSFGTTFRMLADTAYPPVAGGCAGASAAMAVSPDLPKSLRGKLDVPALVLEPGDEARTVLAYSLPKQEEPSKWFSPLFEKTVTVGSTSP